MKFYDKFGLPEDGTDHSKFIIEDTQDLGINTFEIKAHYEVGVKKLAPDIDYKIENMTKEQKEVFEALNSDNEEGIYETLENDFVNIANDGEDIIIKPSTKQPQK